MRMCTVEAVGLTGWFVVVLAAPGLIVLVAVVVAFLFRRRDPGDAAPTGPGYYHVLGFDGQTRAARELTIHAESNAAARGRAELEGIVVTEVTFVRG